MVERKDLIVNHIDKFNPQQKADYLRPYALPSQQEISPVFDFESKASPVRDKMAELMSHGVVLSRKDIRDLTVEIMNSSSSSNVTGTINQTRKIKGHPDFLVGSGKYRGTGIYFDASLEPEQIDFNGVIDRIDTWKEHRVRV